MPPENAIDYIAGAFSLTETEKAVFLSLLEGEPWKPCHQTPALTLLTEPSPAGTRVLKPRILTFMTHPDSPARHSGLTLFYPEMGLQELLFTPEEYEPVARVMQWARQNSEICLLCVYGPPGSGKSSLIRYAAGQSGLSVLFSDFSKSRKELESVKLECLLVGAAACFRGAKFESRDEMDAFVDELYPAVKLVCFTGEEPLPERDSTCFCANLPMPAVSAEKTEWFWRKFSEELPLTVKLPQPPDAVPLTPGRMKSVLRASCVQSAAQGEGTVSESRFREACRQLHAQELSAFGQVVKPVYNWKDLVLPKDRQTILQGILNRLRNSRVVYEQWGFGVKLPYGSGLKLLLSGPPGTGKTMTAIVLASELSLPLLKIDNSAMMSKYIGETEKNLNRVFDAAAKTDCILLFDEADSLFGKRTESKDSHDRYANLQTSFLLQKIEEYNGTAILTTNFQQNFDEAFRRRFHYILTFSPPEKEERLRLWDAVFPQKTPLGSDIDREYLAETFALSGGNIRNIALSAAFYAVEGGTEICMRHILRALREECDKIGSPVSKQTLMAWGEM